MRYVAWNAQEFMSELARSAAISTASAAIETEMLLSQYNFDLGSSDIAQLLADWLQIHPAAWLPLAAIEALYQGRYKAVSIEQILAAWQRRGQPLPHFSADFERMICRNFPARAVEPAPELPKPLPAAKPAEASSETQTAIVPYQPPASMPLVHLRQAGSTTQLQAPSIADSENHPPIDRFVPDPAAPDFYAKLRAVAQTPTMAEAIARLDADVS